MIKTLLTMLLWGLSTAVMACPNCHAMVTKNKPPYTLFILGVFILLTYIPFYILFSAAKRYDPKNVAIND